MAYDAVFQPQNPALNGYWLGWKSCTSYAWAMTADASTQGVIKPSGRRLRELCREPNGNPDITGGTTLAQNDSACLRGFGVDLDVRYRLPWAEFMRMNEDRPAVLQGHGEVFEGTPFYCAASVNHAVHVPAGSLRVKDPAADGRRAGIYDARRELAYPETLLRRFAARLILDPDTGKRLGDGYVYAAFGRDITREYFLRFGTGAFYVYRVVNGAIDPVAPRYAKEFSKATRAPCSAPRLTAWKGHPSKVLVQVTGGALKGQYVAVPQGSVTLFEEP